jgi:hypothetical protein
MDRDGQHPRVSEKHRLHAVAVVHVDVDIGDPLRPVPQQPRNDDGRIVVHAEPAGLLRQRMVQPTGRVERVLRPSRPHRFRRRQRRAHHPQGGFVHLRKDRIVAGPEAKRAPRPVLPVPRPPDDIDVPLAVREQQLILDRIPSDHLTDAFPIDDPVRMDEIPGERDPRRPQWMLRPVVVLRRIISVPDQLHPLTHATIMASPSALDLLCRKTRARCSF